MAESDAAARTGGKFVTSIGAPPSRAAKYTCIMSSFRNRMHQAILKNDVATIQEMITSEPLEECTLNEFLRYAVWSHRPDVIPTFCDAGADINSRDAKSGSTPLHIASGMHWNTEELVKSLVQCGAYVDGKDKKGNTPLSLAFRANKMNVVVLLFENGADINNVTSEALSKYFSDNKMFPTKLSTGIVFFRYVNLMQALDMHLSDEVLHFCSGYDRDSIRLKLAFGEEIPKIKKTLIGKDSLTFYDFLMASDRKLERILRDRNVRELLQSENYKQDFPYYSSLIANHYKRGLYRISMIDWIKNNNCSIFDKLPGECIEVILDYLHVSDITAIVSAVCVVFKLKYSVPSVPLKVTE